MSKSNRKASDAEADLGGGGEPSFQKPTSRSASRPHIFDTAETDTESTTSEDLDNVNHQPKQDVNERRMIRTEYRRLIDETQSNRDFIVNTSSSEDINRKLDEANNLFSKVTMTREAALDSHFIHLLSHVGKQKVQKVDTNLVAFSVDEFAEFIVRKVCPGQVPPQRSDISRQFWDTFGQTIAPYFHRSPPIHLMYGAFQRDPVVVRRPTRQARLTDKEGPVKAVVPSQLQKAEKKETTTEDIERIFTVLQQLYKRSKGDPVDYFEFVTNKHSFGHTIENIFHVAFLVKDGCVRIYLDTERMPVIEPILAPERAKAQEQETRQVIISLTKKQWKEIVRVYKIPDTPHIKPRNWSQQRSSSSSSAAAAAAATTSSAGPTGAATAESASTNRGQESNDDTTAIPPKKRGKRH